MNKGRIQMALWSRFRIAMVAIAVLVGCATKENAKSDTQKRISERRVAEIRRMAPSIGIPVEKALSVRVDKIHECNESGRNSDGSYTCGDCPGTGSDCVHAWFRGAHGNRRVEYLFATPEVKDGTIAHEVMHELLVVWYGIGGHPTRVEVTRLDNGKRFSFRPADVIGWRWPSLVNWALPQSMEIGGRWGSDIKCGTEEMFEDGGGI